MAIRTACASGTFIRSSTCSRRHARFWSLPSGYARKVPFSEIEANEYNLNIPRYIDSSEPEDIQDLGAHLHGGIPQRDIDALDDYWQVFPTLRRSLFRPTKREGYSEATWWKRAR